MAAQQAPPSLGFSRQEHWSGLPFPSPVHECEKWKWSRSVVPDPQRPHGLQPTRLLRPWDFPGKSTGVGCHCPDLTWPSIMIISPTITVLQLHFPPQFSSVQSWTVQFSTVAQSCPSLRDPMDCGPPGSSVHGILQARILEWGAVAFSNTQRLIDHNKEPRDRATQIYSTKFWQRCKKAF